MGQQSTRPPMHRFLTSLWTMAFVLLACGRLAFTQTQATAVALVRPSAIAYDAAGNLYIAETGRHVICKVDLAGNITTIAGTGVQGFSGDGSAATAAVLDSPQGLALDAHNHLYIADTHNNRVREVDLGTGVIRTIAGSTAGFSGDGGAAVNAQLRLPTALAIDAGGNLYVADTGNHRVRRINPATGTITTVAGDGRQGFSGDRGPAIAASIDSPGGLAIDAAGNLLIADTHNQRVRSVDTASGVIRTIAGTGAVGYAGDSGAASAARLALPHGISIDAAGNIYIADTANQRIRRIDATTGAITTVAGNGTQGFSGDDGSATAAALNTPRAAAIAPGGLLTVTDTANRRVRQLDAQAPPDIHTVAGISATPHSVVTLSAAPAMLYGSGQLTASLASATATGAITFTLLNPATGAETTLGTARLAGSTASFDTSGLAAGSYSIIAAYTGDTTHPAAQSSPLAFTITPLPITATPDSVTLLYGQPIPKLTGSLVGELPQDDASLDASFTTSAGPLSPVANYPISVTLTGAAAKNYAVTTATANVTIAPAPTLTTLSPSQTTLATGAALTLTAQTASTTAGVPTGSIVIRDGSSTLLNATMPATGSVSMTTSALAAGQHTITTVYSGDRNFIASAATPEIITVIPTPTADFSLGSSGATTQTIPSGGSASFNFTLQIQGTTLASPITLAASGLPAFATASFNPAYLPPGTTPDSFTLTINTAQAAAGFDRGVSARGSKTAPLLGLLLFPVFGLTLRRRVGAGAMVCVAVFAALALISGCGSRINSSDSSTGTPATYAITVTGTATSPSGSILQHSTTVKLVVEPVQ